MWARDLLTLVDQTAGTRPPVSVVLKRDDELGEGQVPKLPLDQYVLIMCIVCTILTCVWRDMSGTVVMCEVYLHVCG